MEKRRETKRGKCDKIDTFVFCTSLTHVTGYCRVQPKNSQIAKKSEEKNILFR